MTEQGALTSDAAEFAARHERRWLVSNYKAGKSTCVLAPSAADADFPGDVVFHHPCMIHCSARNLDPDNRIRLATDLRFADKRHPYDARWANNYCGCEALARFCNGTDPRTVFPNDGL
jgi:phytanoyl-CoA hydroxylase